MKTDRSSPLLPRVTRLRLTDAVRCRIAIVRRAARLVDAIGYSKYELAKVEIAEEILALVDDQEHAARLRQLPATTVAAVVDVRLVPKRRRRSA